MTLWLILSSESPKNLALTYGLVCGLTSAAHFKVEPKPEDTDTAWRAGFDLHKDSRSSNLGASPLSVT
jgi:hypothetical protein